MTVQNGPLPKGWREVRLGEISKFSKGSGITKSEVRDTGVPCIRYGELYTKHNLKVRNFYSFISNKDLDKRKLIKNNDLLFAGSGETREEIGKCASFNHDIRAYAGGDVIICSLDPKEVRADFASCYLNTIGRKQMNRLGQGNSIVHIYSRYLEDVVIPLPSIEEQKAIASLLEKWDTAIEKTEALIEAKEKRFKWLLKTLISDQQNNPEWREVGVRLEDACEVIVSPVDKKTVDEELPVKLCNYTDVYYNNTIDSKINFMAATAKPREIEKFSIITDDVIITKDSETPDDIGVPAYVKETIDNLLCGYHLTILRPKKQTIGKYMCYALTSPRVKYDFYRFANGITRFGLTKESYQKIKIPLPLPPEQKRIANILDTAKEEVEFLEQLAEQYRTQKRGLMQKLLTGEWRINTNLGEH